MVCINIAPSSQMMMHCSPANKKIQMIFAFNEHGIVKQLDNILKTRIKRG